LSRGQGGELNQKGEKSMKFISRYQEKSGFPCEDCGAWIAKGTNYYVLTNWADETVKCCPDCAAHRMAETLDAVNKTVYSDCVEF
jgi:hypothetical protein